MLLVDDVADSGRTLALAVRMLQDAQADVRSVCIYTKPGSVASPDYSWRETDRWIDFPWSAAGTVAEEDAGAPALVVSQFTLYGDVRKGRRPSWTRSAKGEQAQPLYERFMAELESSGVRVERGVFGAMMDVSLTNSGPFTLIVDSDELAGPRRG